MNAELPKLPCYPCPHAASCCAYGTTLTDDEAAAIQASLGEEPIYRTRWGEWRTRIKNGRCALYQNGGCVIHDQPHYPAVCAGFPWIDAEHGGPYEFDLDICGEFVNNPELVAIQRARPMPARV